MQFEDLIFTGPGYAVVCYQNRITECGPGDEWFVRDTQGYLYNCGVDKARAIDLANRLNASVCKEASHE